MNTAATQVIDKLGGTAKVAQLFSVAMPSVSDWKKDGIPPARVMFLRVAKRKELADVDLEAATARKPKPTTEAA